MLNIREESLKRLNRFITDGNIENRRTYLRSNGNEKPDLKILGYLGFVEHRSIEQFENEMHRYINL